MTQAPDELLVELPWALWPWDRCRAGIERRGGSPYYGRCDLRRHGPEVDHALERGLVTPRWSTVLTGF